MFFASFSFLPRPLAYVSYNWIIDTIESCVAVYRFWLETATHFIDTSLRTFYILFTTVT